MYDEYDPYETTLKINNCNLLENGAIINLTNISNEDNKDYSYYFKNITGTGRGTITPISKNKIEQFVKLSEVSQI